MTKPTPDLSFERAAVARGAARVAGVDEVGRGPLAGPVTAAAVVLDPENIPPGLNDSKVLTAKRRAGLFDAIMAVAQVSVAHASVAEIDELNGYSHRTNQRLRSLFMRGFADQLVAVAAGVGIAREWDHEGSPWYNFFEELEVGPIDTEAARGLATRPLDGVIGIDDEAVDRLLEKADGRPYILQKIALAAVQRVHENRRSRITLEDVEGVIGS